MRAAFVSLPTKAVTLRRLTGESAPDADGKTAPVFAELELELRPWAIGYTEMLARVFPEPVTYLNSKPLPDAAAAQEHGAARVYLLIAACMGDQLDAKAPSKANSDRDAWAAYASAVRSEFEAAHLVDGDVSLLYAEALQLNRGHSRPKA